MILGFFLRISGICMISSSHMNEKKFNLLTNIFTNRKQLAGNTVCLDRNDMLIIHNSDVVQQQNENKCMVLI